MPFLSFLLSFLSIEISTVTKNFKASDSKYEKSRCNSALNPFRIAP